MWAWNDLEALKSVSVGGRCGIQAYVDGSGKAAYDSAAYAAEPWVNDGGEITAADLKTFVQTWWDGTSPGWMSDEEYGGLCREGHKVNVGEDHYMLRSRSTFGDGDSQHLITCAKGKQGIIFGHTDFSIVWGFFDEEAGYPNGTVALKVQALLEGYKDGGF